MLGKILSVVFGALTSNTANKAVGATNVIGWLALIPVAGYVWTYRDEIITFQASVGSVGMALIIGYAFVSAIIAVAQKSTPTPPPYYPPSGRAD